MIHPEFVEQFDAYSLFICGDDPESSDRLSKPIAPHFDHCFPVNVACVDDYVAWGAKRVDWIFHALRPGFVDPEMTREKILQEQREIDVTMFCERIHGLSDRAQRLERLHTEFPHANLRGQGWPGGFAKDGEIRNTYRQTRIGWNFHHSIGPCNSRMYMLPAFGVLQICDNKDNLGRILELDREVIGFDTLEECIDKTHYYLTHEDERREIAARGFERVTRDFTVEKHMAYLLTKIEEGVREKRGIQTPAITPSPLPIPSTIEIESTDRPRVLILADRPGWAYDIEAQNVTRVLAEEYDVQVRYVAERPDLSQEEFDLLWVCFWGETWHQQFGIPCEKVIKQVSSHRWRMDPDWGQLDTETFVARHLADAGTICAISDELVEMITPYRTCFRVEQGVDPRGFRPGPDKEGPLRIGFAGNAQDSCKGLEDILLPACGNEFELRIAGGDLDHATMPAFYQQLDVLCIASTAEGGPLPLLEAMACGCLVVSTAVGIAPELIEHGKNGLIVPRTPADFRSALEWCRHNREWIRQQGRANAVAMQEGRTWDRVAPGWKKVLDRARSGRSEVLQPTAPPKTVQAQLKQGYADHLKRVNPAATSEETYQAAGFYYEAEIAALLPEDRSSRCLELGCGFGHLLRWLNAKGFGDCSGVEIDAQVHETAKAYLGNRFRNLIHADALDYLQRADEQYDLIVAFDFIEHFTLEEAHEVLTLMQARLTDGGQVLLRTPNMANLFGIYSRYMDLTHRLGFTEQSLRQLLVQTGYSDVSLALPEWPQGHPLSQRLDQSRSFHEQIFDMQDRSRPTCFDKNLVLMARKPAAVMSLR